MYKIISRYLFREVAYTLAAVGSVLILIFVSHRLVRILAEAAVGRISSDLVPQLLGLKLVGSLGFLLPLIFFLAVILALGRLHRDSEITAIRAGGLGMMRLVRVVGVLGILFAVPVAVLTLYLSPLARSTVQEIYLQAKDSPSLGGIQAGRFTEFSDGEQVLYVERVRLQEARMEGVFAQARDTDGGERMDVLYAQRASQQVVENGDRFMIMEDGYRYGGEPGGADYVITRFRTHGLRIEEGAVGSGHRKITAWSNAELTKSDNPAHLAELQWRFSLPLSVIILAVLAVPLSQSAPRQGKYARFFTAVVVYFGYTNLLGVARSLVERGEIGTTVGLGWVHIGFALVSFGLLFYHRSGQWYWAALCRRWRRTPRSEDAA